MVNPSLPKNQLTGVFSLETARLYNYIYQRTDKNYTIVYSLDGYDEISLTSECKLISNNEEQLLTPENIGFPQIQPDDILGGKTVEESAGIFMKILNGNGTPSMNAVVTVNAGMALRCIHSEKSMEECIETAKESLLSKKALQAFKNLIELN